MACIVCNSDLSGCNPGAWGLSVRETEVLVLVCAGHTNDAVAQCLAMSTRTAQAHVAKALVKSGTLNRTHLAVCALRRGLVSLDGCPCHRDDR